MNKGIIALAAAVVIVLIAGVVLLNNGKLSPATSNSSDTTSEDHMMNDDAMMDDTSMSDDHMGEDSMMEGDVVEFDVKNEGLSFVPDTFTVKKGQKVRVTFTSSGGSHDFMIDEFNVATKRVNSGESDTVEFVADQAGKFEYYCSVPGHRAAGMVGTLVVTE